MTKERPESWPPSDHIDEASGSALWPAAKDPLGNTHPRPARASPRLAEKKRRAAQRINHSPRTCCARPRSAQGTTHPAGPAWSSKLRTAGHRPLGSPPKPWPRLGNLGDRHTQDRAEAGKRSAPRGPNLRPLACPQCSPVGEEPHSLLRLRSGRHALRRKKTY